MNEKFSFQAKVGMFVLAGIAGIVLIASTIEPLKFRHHPIGGMYYFRFSNVAGLEKEAPVRVSGVTVGKVSEIEVTDRGAVVSVVMFKDVKLHKDASARIETMGLMGEKYVEINPGSPDEPLISSGEVVLNTKSAVSTDQLIAELYNTAQKFNSALIDEHGRNRLAMIMENISKLSENVNDLLEENRKNIKKALENTVAVTEFLKNELPTVAENINTLATQLGQIALENREDIRNIVVNINEAASKAPEIAKRLEELTGNLKELLNKNNRENISELLKNMRKTTEELKTIVAKVNEGNGTIGKLFNDESLYTSITNATKTFNRIAGRIERIQTFVGFRGDVNTRTGDTRGAFTFKISPSENHYYLFEVVGDSQGRVDRKKYYVTTSSGSTEREEIEKSYRTEFTLQYARVFRDPWLHDGGKWVLKGGLKENTGGIGLDYIYNSNLALVSDLWDAGREKSNGDDIPPHLRVGVKYWLNPNWYIYLGGDELLYSKYRGPYLGLGVLFGDEDIKYLLGSVPTGSMK